MMKKTLISLFGLLSCLSAVLTSCSKDTEAVDVYADWQNRNLAYMDSIVSVYKKPPQGETWERFLDYKLQISSGGGVQVWDDKLDYVYVKVLERNVDNPGRSPMGTDTVQVHYAGKLINGTQFDASYSGTWNPDVSMPVSFQVSSLRSGWTTALLHMYEGDHVELYIPYTMAYGTSGTSGSSASNTIPGYSTLIFDVRLEKIIHPKGPDDRARKKDAGHAARRQSGGNIRKN